MKESWYQQKKSLQNRMESHESIKFHHKCLWWVYNLLWRKCKYVMNLVWSEATQGISNRYFDKSKNRLTLAENFTRLFFSWWYVTTGIHLLYDEIHHDRQVVNKTEIWNRKQLTHKVTIGLKVATGFSYK